MTNSPSFENGADALGAGAESILESISDGVFTVDRDWRIASFNRAAEKITGVARRDAVGQPCCDVFRASMCENDCALRRTMHDGRPVVSQSAFIVNAAGRRVPVSVSTAILRNAEGRVIGGAETFRDLSLIEELRKELAGRFQLGDIVSRSPLMRRLFDLLPPLAQSDATALIRGETGTGKELLARALHDLGPRRNKPFVPVHCGALPDTLLESELFGYVKGAFTGAARDKPGRFARAEGGTVFLDEIGDISPALQVRLLRVLQERTFEPLGGTHTCRADVRIVAATHRDLATMVRDGLFREDLFYRLNVIQLELPPLRARREDIPLLADHFVARFNRLQGKTVTGVATEALAPLMAHDWPGNVRELENVIERAFVLCVGGAVERRHLPPELVGAPQAAPTPAGRMDDHKRAAERSAILAALERCGNNRLAAARELGVHKCTLFRKIKALGLHPPRSGTR
jgi:PAS domain S-box-containing protein